MMSSIFAMSHHRREFEVYLTWEVEKKVDRSTSTAMCNVCDRTNANQFMIFAYTLLLHSNSRTSIIALRCRSIIIIVHIRHHSGATAVAAWSKLMNNSHRNFQNMLLPFTVKFQLSSILHFFTHFHQHRFALFYVQSNIRVILTVHYILCSIPLSMIEAQSGWHSGQSHMTIAKNCTKKSKESTMARSSSGLSSLKAFFFAVLEAPL